MSRSKIMSMQEAIGLIHDGDTVATGGTMLQGEPVALEREIVRQKKRDLFYVPMASTSMGGELLIGAGCVGKMALTVVGFMRYCPVGPRFRDAMQAGKLQVYETEQSQKLSSLRAAGRGLPFMPNIVGPGTDYPKVNPFMKVIPDPFGGEDNVVAMKSIEPDFMIVATAVSDAEGNAQHGGIYSYDVVGSRAAKKVIVLAEDIVRPEYIKANPHKTTILGYNVVAVVEAPFGAHPTSNHGNYRYDAEHIKEYVRAARTPEGFADYAQTYVHSVPDHVAYLERIGLRRLLELKTRR